MCYCKQCGKKLKKNQKSFCSRSCNGKNSKTKFFKGHKTSKKIKEKISRTKLKNSVYKTKYAYCKNCNKKFKFTEKKYLMNRVFCSVKCKNKYGGRRGVSLSLKTRKLMSLKMSGKRHYGWKGGLSKQRKLNSFKYREWRKKVFERDNYTCQKCFNRGGYLEAHHKIPWSVYKQGWYKIDNGETLCRECHKKETIKFMKKNWKNQYKVWIL